MQVWHLIRRTGVGWVSVVRNKWQGQRGRDDQESGITRWSLSRLSRIRLSVLAVKKAFGTSEGGTPALLGCQATSLLRLSGRLGRDAL